MLLHMNWRILGTHLRWTLGLVKFCFAAVRPCPAGVPHYVLHNNKKITFKWMPALSQNMQQIYEVQSKVQP